MQIVPLIASWPASAVPRTNRLGILPTMIGVIDSWLSPTNAFLIQLRITHSVPSTYNALPVPWRCSVAENRPPTTPGPAGGAGGGGGGAAGAGGPPGGRGAGGL